MDLCPGTDDDSQSTWLNSDPTRTVLATRFVERTNGIWDGVKKSSWRKRAWCLWGSWRGSNEYQERLRDADTASRIKIHAQGQRHIGIDIHGNNDEMSSHWMKWMLNVKRESYSHQQHIHTCTEYQKSSMRHQRWSIWQKPESIWNLDWVRSRMWRQSRGSNHFNDLFHIFVKLSCSF